MPASTPAETEGHRSLLTDPAAPTRVLREGEQPTGLTSGDPLGEPAPAVGPAPIVDPGPAAADINAPAPFGPQSAPNPFAPAPFGPQPAPYVAPPAEPVADLPAGLDPDELAAAPGTSARRGKLRRRVAFLRAARELLLRDLGGFVYELHRTAHDIEAEAHRRLRETKLARLARVDAELHELEMRLDDVRRQVLVREPGVGGECPHCGELFGSAAHYCSHCGNPLTEAARRELAKAQQPVAPAPPVVAPEPAPAATTDQPTQEIAPLDPNAAFQWPARPGEGEPETARPQTGEAGSEAATPVGDGEPATAIHAGEAPSEAAGAAPDEAATPVGDGDPATAAPQAGEAATPVGEGEPATAIHAGEGPSEAAAAAPDEAATPVGDGEPATAIHAADGEAPSDSAIAAADDTPHAADEAPREAAAEDAPQVADEAPREAATAAPDDAPHAADEAAQADDAPRDATTGDAADSARPASNGSAPADSAGGDYETWRGEAANGRDDSIYSPVERRP